MSDAFAALSEKIAGFEERAGQLEMEQAVERALAAESHLAVEAPCGIGKTFAYLVPAIRHAVRKKVRIVVCTANIALQEQIVEKDLPALARALPEKFSFALIKGLGNYLCLDRFEQTREQLAGITFDKKGVRHWNKIVEWRSETVTGDISDLDFEPEDEVWNRVNGVSELCTGQDCRYFQNCFAMEARRRVRDVQVIVTNYHLFFAHLKVKIAAGRDMILPGYGAVICDEAHDMADIARDFFGMRLSPFSASTLVSGAYKFRMGNLGERLKNASRRFFAGVEDFAKGARYKNRLREPGFADGHDLLNSIVEYRRSLSELEKTMENEEEVDRLRKLLSAADHYEDRLSRFLALDDKNMVYWIDRGRLVSRVIDPSDVLKKHLFDETPTILTSATLTAAGSFDFLKRETGAENAATLVVPSPFDFKTQAALIVPGMKARPNDPMFPNEIAGHINRIIKKLGGRTMCLFTSYRNLEYCADAAEGTGVKILRQGDKPRSKLLKEFRKDEGTALFATASFWQGVDIPGEALSCLVIDKLPFIPPDDPLLDALQERDPQCFQNYSLPKAVLALRQGFGRLIRTKTDRGVVVIFDARLFASSYGQEFLRSLPECPIHRDLDALDRFFASTNFKESP